MPKPKAGILTPLLRVKTGPVTAGDAILYVDMCECGGGIIVVVQVFLFLEG